MSKKPVPVKLKSDQGQKASVHEAGLILCRKHGHLKSKHYVAVPKHPKRQTSSTNNIGDEDTTQGMVEFRCARCGRLLGILSKKEKGD